MQKTKQKFRVKKIFYKKRAKTPRTGFAAAAVVIALILAVSLLWDDIVCLTPYCSSAVTKYMIGSNPNRKIGAVGSGMAICGNDGLYVIGKDGKENSSFITAFPSPLMSVSDFGTAVASENSKEFYIIDTSGKSTQIVTDNQIKNLKMSDGGYTAAIMHQPGYNGVVTVYSKKGTALFNWAAGKSNLIDAAVSADGHTLAVSAVDFSQISLECRLLLFDISNSKQPYATYDFGENLVSHIRFCSGKILCVGDRAFVVCAQSGKEKWRLDYGDRMLNFFDVSNKNNLVFVLGASTLDRNMSVCSYNIYGKKRGEYSDEFDISYVCASKNRTIIASNRELRAISPNGKLKNTKTSEKDLMHISMFKKGSCIFADEGGFAEIFMIK